MTEFVTEVYCPTLRNVSPVDSIRAIHQAWLQLKATAETAAPYDNAPAIAALEAVLRTAGYQGLD